MHKDSEQIHKILRRFVDLFDGKHYISLENTIYIKYELGVVFDIDSLQTCHKH